MSGAVTRPARATPRRRVLLGGVALMGAVGAVLSTLPGVPGGAAAFMAGMALFGWGLWRLGRTVRAHGVASVMGTAAQPQADLARSDSSWPRDETWFAEYGMNDSGSRNATAVVVAFAAAPLVAYVGYLVLCGIMQRAPLAGSVLALSVAIVTVVRAVRG